jgi:hypothetical protein
MSATEVKKGFSFSKVAAPRPLPVPRFAAAEPDSPSESEASDSDSGPPKVIPLREDRKWTDESVKQPLLMRAHQSSLEDVSDEDEKFRQDIASRPDQASLADYGKMPIGDFGEACLRGMGWAPGRPIGLSSTTYVLQPRSGAAVARDDSFRAGL